jgi:hypothetical protein
MFPTIQNSAYVITSPYTSVQVPLTASRPVAPALTPTFYYQPNTPAFIQTPTMMYTSVVDSYLNQKNYSTPAFVHSSPHIVYTSIAGELITHQSLLNSEKKVDQKINETVQSHMKKYEMEKLKEEEIKKSLTEHEKNKILHEWHCDHHDVKHNHEEEHKCHDKHEQNDHHHHHHQVCERTQGSQTSFAELDKKCCCCSSDHKLPVCTHCVNTHSDCCLERRIRRIRKELNLPSEIKQEHDHREHVTSSHPKVIFSNVTTYEIDTRKSRSRSKKSSNAKSRSPSANSRPQWIPTGANDYTWTNQTRSQILNNQYRPASAAANLPSKHSDKGNQTAPSNDITIVYPTKTIKQIEYHEVPVTVEKTPKSNLRLTRSRSNSCHRSVSPIAFHNNNDYCWTTQTFDNHNNSMTTTTSTTKNHNNNIGAKPFSETFYTYETIKPKTSVDHFYVKNNNNYAQHILPQNTDYYYYENKPKTVSFVEKSTSTMPNNAVSTQTVAQKPKSPSSSSSLGTSKDCLNKFNVYIK